MGCGGEAELGQVCPDFGPVWAEFGQIRFRFACSLGEQHFVLDSGTGRAKVGIHFPPPVALNGSGGQANRGIFANWVRCLCLRRPAEALRGSLPHLAPVPVSPSSHKPALSCCDRWNVRPGGQHIAATLQVAQNPILPGLKRTPRWKPLVPVLNAMAEPLLPPQSAPPRRVQTPPSAHRLRQAPHRNGTRPTLPPCQSTWWPRARSRPHVSATEGVAASCVCVSPMISSTRCISALLTPLFRAPTQKIMLACPQVRPKSAKIDLDLLKSAKHRPKSAKLGKISAKTGNTMAKFDLNPPKLTNIGPKIAKSQLPGNLSTTFAQLFDSPGARRVRQG